MIQQMMENLPEWANWAAFDRDGGFWAFAGHPFIPHASISCWTVLHSEKMEMAFHLGRQAADRQHSCVRLQQQDAPGAYHPSRRPERRRLFQKIKMDANEHDGTPEEAADPSLEELDCQIEKEIEALLEMTGGLPDPAALTDPKVDVIALRQQAERQHAFATILLGLDFPARRLSRISSPWPPTAESWDSLENKD